MLRIVTLLAWRNLWRNHRRTVVMISAVTVGVWAMIFMTALMRGMVNDMLRDGIRVLPGHVQVHHPAFRDDPSVNNLLPMNDSQLSASFSTADFAAWSSRVKVPAVITSERDSRGVILFGIDPVLERDISFVADDMVAGRFLQDINDSGVVIGQELAEILETEIGKRVVIMSQDPANEIADRGFRIVGLFKSKLEAYEKTMIFTAKATTQKMLKIGDRANELVVMGEDYRDVATLVDQVRAVSGENVEVLPWFEVDTYLGTMMAVMDGFVLVWVVVIFLALSFGLVNTLVMAVFERVREIGLMLALGMRPSSILGQIIVESILLLAIGLFFGNVLAWLSVIQVKDGIDISIVSEGMEMFGAASVLYPELILEDVVRANIVVLVLGFFASLSPAWRASRYEPIEAITKA